MFNWETPTPEDISHIQRQLGRKPQGVAAIAVRCRYNVPQVVVNYPLLWEGKPAQKLPGNGTHGMVGVFPTLFWLTCPEVRAAIGRLESAGWVRKIKDELANDPTFLQDLIKSHEKTAQIRKSMLSEETLNQLEKNYPRQFEVINQSGIAGMRPESISNGVKCLHAHFADYLALHSNPIGKRIFGLLTHLGTDPRGLECIHCPLDTLNSPLGIIDVGSNSLRLLIGKVNIVAGAKTFSPLYKDLVTTRLGQGLSNSKPEKGIEKSLQTLKDYKDKAKDYGVNEPIAIGTATLREAEWAEEFLIRAWEEAGVSIRVISGEEEALLSFIGAQNGLKLKPNQLSIVVDIGGASTEVVIGTRNGRMDNVAISCPIGAVRLKQMVKEAEDDVEKMLGVVKEIVESPLHSCLKEKTIDQDQDQEYCLIAVGGTATSLAAMDQGLLEYRANKVTGYKLPLERLQWWITNLSLMDEISRREIRGLQPQRADIILPGAIILYTIVMTLHSLGIVGPEVIINDSDLMQGIALSLGKNQE